MTTFDPSRAVWKKSSRSSGNGQCVEVAEAGDFVAVRDSKDPGGGVLLVPRKCWSYFVNEVLSMASRAE